MDAVLELLFRVSVTRRAVSDQNNRKIKGGGKTHRWNLTNDFCNARTSYGALCEKKATFHHTQATFFTTHKVKDSDQIKTVQTALALTDDSAWQLCLV